MLLWSGDTLRSRNPAFQKSSALTRHLSSCPGIPRSFVRCPISSFRSCARRNHVGSEQFRCQVEMCHHSQVTACEVDRDQPPMSMVEEGQSLTQKRRGRRNMARGKVGSQAELRVDQRDLCEVCSCSVLFCVYYA